MRTSNFVLSAALITCGLIMGCEGRSTLIPNSDPALRRTSTEFAADAAKRFPYPTDAAKAGAASVADAIGREPVMAASLSEEGRGRERV